MTRPRQRKQGSLRGFWENVERELFGLPLVVSCQPQVVADVKELQRLEELMREGRDEQVKMFLEARTKRAIRYWEEHLGARRGRGRPCVKLFEREPLRIACLVQSSLPKFKEAFRLKRKLINKIRDKQSLAKALDAAGCPGEIVARSKTPVAAAVKAVAYERRYEVDSVAQYYKQYRGLLMDLANLPPPSKNNPKPGI